VIHENKKLRSFLVDAISLAIIGVLYIVGAFDFKKYPVVATLAIMALVTFRLIWNIRNYGKTKKEVYLGWSLLYGFGIIILIFIYVLERS
jgi:hypothetical protein